MGTSKANHVPKYRYHKATGQAYVELSGRRIYLGKFDLPETREAFHRTVAEWMANGRRIPVAAHEITVAELLAQYMDYAVAYYRKANGEPTSEVHELKAAIRPLNRLYGRTKAAEFGPLALRTVREAMIEHGYARRTVNAHMGRIKRVFAWGVEREIVPATVHHGLTAVIGLRKGRSAARETKGVAPVPDAVVDATLPHMTSVLRAMVEVQRLAGMRPGEVCILRACDLDMSGSVWTYRPAEHKTDHYDKIRTVFIGPKGQTVLRPFLRRDLTAYLFSPAESEAERRAQQHRNRKTLLSCGNRPGTNRKRQPKKQPQDRYTTQTYGRAVTYSCDRAFPPSTGTKGEALKAWRREHRWAPKQLRHTFGTEARREHGLEAAQVLLGHAAADVTQVYAERDVAKAVSVAAKIG